MTELNGPETRGAVMLGGRQRTIVLSRDEDAKLIVLAKMMGHNSPTDVLGYLVSTGIERGWQEMMVAKLMWVCANWLTWCQGWGWE